MASDSVNDILVGALAAIQDHFHALLLAQASHTLGGSALDAIGDDVRVTAVLGVNVHMEPIPVAELRAFRSVYPNFMIEAFHAKLLQYWHDVIHRIFCYYVDEHLGGRRPFEELGRVQLKIDFASKTPLVDQLRLALAREFDVRRYPERYRLINKIRNPATLAGAEADIVCVHVHLRNAFQHHHGIVRDFVLRELGRSQIEVLDETGRPRILTEGCKATLSVAEVDKLRRAILMVAQTWRTKEQSR